MIVFKALVSTSKAIQAPKIRIIVAQPQPLINSMAIILVVLLALSIIFLFQICRVRKDRPTLTPPGPRGLPFIGNLHQLDNSALHHQLWKLSQKYGPLMSLRLGFSPLLVVSSAKMAKEVLKTQDLIFCSRPSLFGLQKLSYNCLDVAISPYNDYWREMKKTVILHLFSSHRVKSFLPIREQQVSRMITKIEEVATSSQLINLSKIIVSLTSDMVCQVAFSKRFDEGHEGSSLHRLFNEFQAVAMSFYFSDYFPYMGWLDSLRGLHARLDKNFNEMDCFYQQLIDEHLDPAKRVSTREDIIDIFLKIKHDKSSSFDFTFDHIKALLMNILLAGTDTSAATVVWAMTLLMKNPKAMRKAQEEVRDLVGKKRRFVDEDELQKLPYLEAVIKETLRLHPVIPLLLPRITLQSCVVDGHEIKPKTLVYVNAYAIGRDPESWTDPEEFFPERFMVSNIDIKGLDFELIPFGAGRRKCPGISMGMATVKLALSNLLCSFDWELPDGMNKEDLDTDPMLGVVVQKKNDLCLVAKKI